MAHISVLLLLWILGATIETQTDWYCGPGTENSVTKWGNSFDSSCNIVYSIPNQLSLSPSGIDTSNWKLYVVDANSSINGHNFIVPADMNLDGSYDLVGAFSHFVVWYEQKDSFQFTKHIIDSTITVGTHGTIWPCDLDRDGDSDIVVSGDSGLYWIENNNLVFTKHLIASGAWYFARAVDVNNDGYVDIVAQKGNSASSNSWEGPVYIFCNDGSMNFASSSLPNSDTTWRTNLADFNNDGFVDIQTSGLSSKCVRVYLNDGAGNFNLVYRYKSNSSIDGSWPGDINADGFMDITVNIQNGDFFWLENDGTGTNFTYHSITSGMTKYGDGGMAEDIDMSGKVDVIGGYKAIGWFEQKDSGVFKEHFLGNVSDCHWVYGCNLGKGPCGQVSDISMDILFSDKGKFAFWKNQMVTGYDSSSWLESSIFDASEDVAWLTFGWHDCVPQGYTVNYMVRCGESVAAVESSAWSAPIGYSGDTLPSIFPKSEYFQYRIEMVDSSGTAKGVATIDTIWIEYEDHPGAVKESSQKKALACFYNMTRNEIEYTLTKESKVSFRIYDITGRVVSTVNMQNEKAGNHTIELKLPSGIYLAKLVCNNGTVIKKCVVIR